MDNKTFERIMNKLGSRIINKPVYKYDSEDMIHLFNKVLDISKTLLSDLDLITPNPGKERELEYCFDDELVETYKIIEAGLRKIGNFRRSHPALVEIENLLKARDPNKNWDLY